MQLALFLLDILDILRSSQHSDSLVHQQTPATRHHQSACLHQEKRLPQVRRLLVSSRLELLGGQTTWETIVRTRESFDWPIRVLKQVVICREHIPRFHDS